MTMQEIQKICTLACAKYDVEFNVNITINARLTRTLGRVISEVQENGEWRPTKFELSKQLVEQGTEDTIRDVVLHECAHYIAIETSREAHGHDAYFRSICYRIGTTNDGMVTKDAKFKLPEEKRHKYSVYCNHCNEFVGGFAKMCPTLKHIDECYCKRCGQYELTYKQNW